MKFIQEFFKIHLINSLNYCKILLVVEDIMAKLNITVCMGSSCFARGNEKNLAFLESYIQEHGLEAEINLAGSLCEGKCAKGPNIIVNGVEYNNVDEAKIEKILNSEL